MFRPLNREWVQFERGHAVPLDDTSRGSAGCSSLAAQTKHSRKRVEEAHLWPCCSVDGPVHTSSSQHLRSGATEAKQMCRVIEVKDIWSPPPWVLDRMSYQIHTGEIVAPSTVKELLTALQGMISSTNSFPKYTNRRGQGKRRGTKVETRAGPHFHSPVRWQH